jgi:hypothetical protein
MSLHRPHFDPLRFVSFVGRKKTREEAIAEIAYFRAMQRGFTPGHELEDWVEAEAEFHRGQVQALGNTATPDCGVRLARPTDGYSNAPRGQATDGRRDR